MNTHREIGEVLDELKAKSLVDAKRALKSSNKKSKKRIEDIQWKIAEEVMNANNAKDARKLVNHAINNGLLSNDDALQAMEKWAEDGQTLKRQALEALVKHNPDSRSTQPHLFHHWETKINGAKIDLHEDAWHDARVRGNFTIRRVLSDLQNDAYEYLSELINKFDIDYIRINSLVRATGGRPHSVGRGIDIKRLTTRNNEEALFVRNQFNPNDTENSLERRIRIWSKDNALVSQVITPWFYTGVNRIYWWTDATRNLPRRRRIIGRQIQFNVRDWQENLLRNDDSGIEFGHRHHLHITIR